MARREFRLRNDTSDKFWTVEVVGSTVVATNGRIGASPRETRKVMPTPEAAQGEAERQVADKLRKGYTEGAIAALGTRARPNWSEMPMSEETFWRIIALLNWKKTGDDDAVLKPAVAALAEMPSTSICLFEDMLAAKLHALDTERHAREIGDDAFRPGAHFSVDWFLYVRCAAVASGRAFYEEALANPASMPKDVEFEALLSLPDAAHQKKSGTPLDHVATPSYETYSNSAGWPSSER
jgi:predicted DNA-binding WGR domain protein